MMKIVVRIAAMSVTALVLGFGYILTMWPASACVHTM